MEISEDFYVSLTIGINASSEAEALSKASEIFKKGIPSVGTEDLIANTVKPYNWVE